MCCRLYLRSLDCISSCGIQTRISDWTSDLCIVRSFRYRAFLLKVRAARWRYKNGQYDRNGHHPCNEVKPLSVAAAHLPKVSKQRRSKGGSECPWEHHRAENRPDVPRPEIIRCEGRRYTVCASIAHHEDECDASKGGDGRDAVVRPEKDRFNKKHQEESRFPRSQRPGPTRGSNPSCRSAEASRPNPRRRLER